QLAPMPANAAQVPSVEPPPAPGKSGDGPPRSDNSALPGKAASGAGGPASQTRTALEGGPLFAVPKAAKSVVYVSDRSGSMGERGRLALARRELEASLHSLPESTVFQVVVYNRRAEMLRIAGRTGLVPATPENIRQATHLLNGLEPEG